MNTLQALLLFACLACLNLPSSSESISYLSNVKELGLHMLTHGADVCGYYEKEPKKTNLLILVNSLIYSVKDRQRTRVTWDENWVAKQKKMRLVFFVGQPKNQTQLELLHKENDMYNDIVWSNVPDGESEYLTMKAVSWLKWVIDKCAKAKFVLKIEEKMIVNVPAVKKLIHKNKHAVNTIWGDKQDKGLWNWLTSFLHPHYCTEIGYLMTSDVVKKLYYGALRPIKYNSEENLYLTGIVAKKEGIQVIDNDKFKSMELPSKYSHSDVTHMSADECKSIKNHFIFHTTDNKEKWTVQWTYLLSSLENCHHKKVYPDICVFEVFGTSLASIFRQDNRPKKHFILHANLTSSIN